MSEAARDGIEEARTLFRGAGLDLPPIPAELAGTFKQRGKWCFSSRAVKRWPYEIRDYIAEFAAGRRRDYVLVAHDGHGANSYALHYYLVHGPLRLFLQVAWGGAYMDEGAATADANEGFRLSSELLDGVKEADRRGRLAPRDRLVVVASSFYGGYCTPPGRPKSHERGDLSTTEWPKGAPQDFLRQAIEWCKGK